MIIDLQAYSYLHYFVAIYVLLNYSLAGGNVFLSNLLNKPSMCLPQFHIKLINQKV